MPKLKIAGWIALAVVLAGIGGCLYGRAGTADVRSNAEAQRLRLQLAEARGHVLDARISLYTVNFGDASRHLEYAKNSVSAAKQQLLESADRDHAKQLDAALTQIGQAQELSTKLNQDANSRAAEAARLIGDVMQATPAR